MAKEHLCQVPVRFEGRFGRGCDADHFGDRCVARDDDAAVLYDARSALERFFGHRLFRQGTEDGLEREVRYVRGRLTDEKPQRGGFLALHLEHESPYAAHGHREAVLAVAQLQLRQAHPVPPDVDERLKAFDVGVGLAGRFSPPGEAILGLLDVLGRCRAGRGALVDFLKQLF